MIRLTRMSSSLCRWLLSIRRRRRRPARRRKRRRTRRRMRVRRARFMRSRSLGFFIIWCARAYVRVLCYLSTCRNALHAQYAYYRYSSS
uniref:Uncharacterized protein n=2 Tax=Oryza TaxID=4527 RepID=C0JA16_ORYRU|nr:unknown [Oryza sativa f. spontanea]ACN85197.1 unknown [Oryza rufipogon]